MKIMKILLHKLMYDHNSYTNSSKKKGIITEGRWKILHQEKKIRRVREKLNGVRT